MHYHSRKKLWSFFGLVNTKWNILKDLGTQTVMGHLWLPFHLTYYGSQWCHLIQMWCQINLYRYEMTLGWVNDDFWVNYHLNSSYFWPQWQIFKPLWSFNTIVHLASWVNLSWLRNFGIFVLENKTKQILSAFFAIRFGSKSKIQLYFFIAYYWVFTYCFISMMKDIRFHKITWGISLVVQ